MNLSNAIWLDPIHLLGVVAGGMSLIGVATQLVKSWLTRSTRDLSLLALIVSTTSTVLWLIYGFLQADHALVLSNIIGTTFGFLLLFFKLYFG